MNEWKTKHPEFLELTADTEAKRQLVRIARDAGFLSRLGGGEREEVGRLVGAPAAWRHYTRHEGRQIKDWRRRREEWIKKQEKSF